MLPGKSNVVVGMNSSNALKASSSIIAQYFCLLFCYPNPWFQTLPPCFHWKGVFFKMSRSMTSEILLTLSSITTDKNLIV